MTTREFKLIRAFLEMTQAELASELGIQPNTVSRYETGDLKIPRTVELAMKMLERQLQEKEQAAKNE
jgi:transcriptional regulator with XRE-family HTH domain